MMRAPNRVLQVVLIGACGVAHQSAVAQDSAPAAQAAATAVTAAAQTQGTLEVLLGRQSRQQARAAAANTVGTIPAALRTEQQPIATATSATPTRGEPSNVARNLPVTAPPNGAADSEDSGVPARANTLGRDSPASISALDASAGVGETAASPAPQR